MRRCGGDREGKKVFYLNMDKNLKRAYQVIESAKSDSKGVAIMSGKIEKIKVTVKCGVCFKSMGMCNIVNRKPAKY